MVHLVHHGVLGAEPVDVAALAADTLALLSHAGLVLQLTVALSLDPLGAEPAVPMVEEVQPVSIDGESVVVGFHAVDLTSSIRSCQTEELIALGSERIDLTLRLVYGGSMMEDHDLDRILRIVYILGALAVAALIVLAWWDFRISPEDIEQDHQHHEMQSNDPNP